MTRYCAPLDAGPESDPSTVAERIARLLNALSDEVTGHICEGRILDDVRTLQHALLTGLRAEGWAIHSLDRWRVIPPR